MAGALSVGVATTAGAAILAVSGSATAAPAPSYTAGLDTATFAVTGVLDGNCPVSTGGTEVWIKPGDKINFNSSLAGINVASLPLHLTALAGLNVDAVIDAKTNHPHAIAVRGAAITPYPKTGQPALAAGDHTLSWTATGIPLVGGSVTLPMNSSELQSGAALKWNGVIHVTSDAPKCKISVGTPGVGVSVGPIKVTVPPTSVGIPVPNLPSLPKLPGLPGLPGGGKTTPGGGGNTGGGGGGLHYTPPPLTVPEQAMGGIGPGSGGGGFNGVVPNGGSASQIAVNLPQVPVAGDPAAPTDAKGKAKVITKTLGLASNKAPAAQLPVLLAIIAIIALSLVTATYARLYMLRRDI